MLRLVGILLLIAAGVVGYMGYQKSQTLAGKASTAAAKLNYKITGEASAPNYTRWYLAAGLLAVGGAVCVCLKRR